MQITKRQILERLLMALESDPAKARAIVEETAAKVKAELDSLGDPGAFHGYGFENSGNRVYGYH